MSNSESKSRGGGPPPDPPREEARILGPEDVITTETLDYLIEGVRVRFAPLTPEEIKQAKAQGRSGWYTKDVGRADVRIKEIHYNPEHIGKDPDRVRALALHEALHHAPPVVALDRHIRRQVERANPPQIFAATPRLRELFKLALVSYLGNSVLDRFLEFYAVRGNYRARFLGDFQKKVTASGAPGRDLRQRSLAEQFVQRLLGAERFLGGPNQDQVAPVVAQAFENAQPGVQAIDNVSPYANPLRSKEDEYDALQSKKAAFDTYLLPAFIKLLDQEARQRLEQQQQKAVQQGGKEQEISQELLEELAKLLEKLVQEGKLHYAAPSEQDPLEELLQAARNKSNTALKKMQSSQPPAPRPQEPGQELSGVEQMRQQAEEAGRAAREGRARGIAERAGVSAEAVLSYEKIKESRRREIAELRDQVIEAMREEREAKLGLTERQGEITPGLESEALTAAYAGEPDERVHLKIEEAQRMSRVRLLFVVDVSGSMGGAPMEAARNAFVIINEGFFEAKDKLQEDNLVAEDEEPLEIGLLAFEGGSTMVHPLGAPLDEQAKYRILSQLQAGGGTNDYDALKQAEKEIEERAQTAQEEYIDIMVVLSDGEGDQAAVQAFCNSVRAREKFSLGAFGFGSTNVRAVYGGRPDGLDAVYGQDFADPQTAVPAIGRFLAGRIQREIEKRQTSP